LAGQGDEFSVKLFPLLLSTADKDMLDNGVELLNVDISDASKEVVNKSDVPESFDEVFLVSLDDVAVMFDALDAVEVIVTLNFSE
jgi:hypothetical protein